TGVVDQDVDRAAIVFDPPDKAGNLGRVREIGGVDGASELDRKRLQGIPAASDQRYSGAGAGEVVCQRLTDPPRRPCDQYAFPPEFHFWILRSSFEIVRDSNAIRYLLTSSRSWGPAGCLSL